MIEENKNVQTTPPAPTASTIGPCYTINQIVGHPGTGSLPRTIAPPDHPKKYCGKGEKLLLFSTIFCYLMLDFFVKTRTRFSLRDKRLFDIIEVKITRVDCILIQRIYTELCTLNVHVHNKINMYISYCTMWLTLLVIYAKAHLQLHVYLLDTATRQCLLSYGLSVRKGLLANFVHSFSPAHDVPSINDIHISS